MLFSRQLLKGSQDFFFCFNILIFIYFFRYETIETHALAFLALIILAIGTVQGEPRGKPRGKPRSKKNLPGLKFSGGEKHLQGKNHGGQNLSGGKTSTGGNFWGKTSGAIPRVKTSVIYILWN